MAFAWKVAEFREKKGYVMVKYIGVNHIAIVVNDMKEAVRLYRDTLGLPIAGTTVGVSQDQEVTTGATEFANVVTRMYNFDLGAGALLTAIELPNADITGRTSFADELWPGKHSLTPIGGVDHFAFNVESEADLVEIRQRLIEGGYEVGEIDTVLVYPYWKQLRFFDTYGNAHEFATWDYGNPAWAVRNKTVERDAFTDHEEL